jgi:hypothetical protein
LSIPQASRPARTLEISWEPSNFEKTEYGFVGDIKAFSLTYWCGSYSLFPRFPDRKGVLHQSEEFRSAERAHERANALLREFIADFTATRIPKKSPSRSHSA